MSRWVGVIAGAAVLIALGACGGAKGDGAATSTAPAPTPRLVTPEAFAFDAEGSLYVSDCEGFRIFKLEPSGRLSLVAGIGGTGYGQFSGDGGLADKAELGCPAQLAFDPDGVLYFADHIGNRVRIVDQEGKITTFAGSGPAGLNAGSLAGDGGRATAARLSEPVGVAFDSEGNLYVSDRDNFRIRRVDRLGIITTFAGTDFGFAGDGGPATRAKLSAVYDIAFDGEGKLFLADSGNNRVRKIDRKGVITTVAGTGEAKTSGDGGLAAKAGLKGPYGVAVDADGNLYVSESDGNRVRKIDPAGIISTVAGTGEVGLSGDGGSATGAKLNGPAGIAVDESGNLYIADYNNARVRVVGTDGVIKTLVGG